MRSLQEHRAKRTWRERVSGPNADARRVLCALLLALTLQAQTTSDVGSGAPNADIKARFINAYFRNGFSNLVTLPPVGDVKKYGATGVIQEFNRIAPALKLALVKASITSTSIPDIGYDVVQVYANMYTYYSGVGVTTAGYPVSDTQGCPTVPGNACTWQLFDKKYALFAYEAATTNGQNFTVRDPFYTNWLAQGGIGVLGPAASAETAVTTPGGLTATVQFFLNGLLSNTTAGTQSGKFYSVRQPIFDTYTNNGGPTGFLGLPTGDELLLSTGKKRQNFEGGAIEYDPAGGGASLRLPVSSLSVTPTTQSLRLGLNDTFTLTAFPRGANGADLGDRAVVWTTSNSRVVTIQSSGLTATVKATGGGTAIVQASSEGKLSLPISVFVNAPCCNIGEGAPNSIISQAFLDAVARNRLTVKIPAANAVRRVGLGYIQYLNDAANDATRYLLALPDKSPEAYLVTGALLNAYETVAGPIGVLGYPLDNPTPAGRQTFENGVLGGTPVRLVSGLIAAKWALLGYETGALGLPAGDAATFFSFAATTGIAQSFQKGVIAAAQTGANAGKAYYVTGPVLVRYLALNAVAGKFGVPINDEFGLNGKRHQDFEGGFFEYSPGQTVALETENPRKPTITTSPQNVLAGTRVRISIGGFDDAATLRVTLPGATDFSVKTATGAYTWEAYVPANATTGVVNIRAVDANGSAVATGSYTIRAAADAKLVLTKIRGDGQSASPGALLPQPLRLSVADANGSPVAGATVRFAASPGGLVNPARALTGPTGEAETTLRLPASEGLALATAEVNGHVITFTARAAGAALSGLVRQTSATDPLIASAATILRYHQTRGELTAPVAIDTQTLVNFLKNFCVFDNQGQQLCDGNIRFDAGTIPNLWRLPAYFNNGLDIETYPAGVSGIRDALSQGSPALLVLVLNGGLHAAVATGIAADGSVNILDPSDVFNRTSLADYLNGFRVGAITNKATIGGVIRFVPKAPLSASFLAIVQGGAPSVTSPAGDCGIAVDFALARILACDGSQQFYQLDVSAPGAYTGYFTDLGNPGARVDIGGGKLGSFKVTKPGPQWLASTLDVNFSAATVVNAASFAPDFAPGGLISVFGTGLGRNGDQTTVEITGVNAPVIFATPFQLNAQVPAELPPGSHQMTIKSPFGSSTQPVDIREVAPAIFKLDATRGAIVNQDGGINDPSIPARRGQVIVAYGTGFGAVERQGNLSVAVKQVTATLNGTPAQVVFAGLTPGFIGLYQVNIQTPASLPPGLNQVLRLQQAGAGSNPVEVAIQ